MSEIVQSSPTTEIEKTSKIEIEEKTDEEKTDKEKTTKIKKNPKRVSAGKKGAEAKRMKS